MASTQLVCAIYVSSAPRKLRTDELEAILASSRVNNARDGITGMLLYADGSFIQAVEGPASAIDALLARLRDDPRHAGIVMIARYPLGDRQFPNWSMGFRSIERPAAQDLAEAFADLRNPVFDAGRADASSIAHKLLEGFRDKLIG